MYTAKPVIYVNTEIGNATGPPLKVETESPSLALPNPNYNVIVVSLEDCEKLAEQQLIGSSSKPITPFALSIQDARKLTKDLLNALAINQDPIAINIINFLNQ